MGLTREALRAYLAERMGLEMDGIDDDTPLFSSSLLDSFSMVDLIMFIEQEAGIRMSPTDVNLDNLDSVGRIVVYCSEAGNG